MNGQMTSDLAWSVIIFAFISSLTALLAGLVIARRTAPGARAFATLCFGSALSSLGYAAELLLPTLDGKLIAAQIQYLGVVWIPLAWLAMALQVTGYPWLTRRRLAWLLIEPVVMLVLVLTNPYHGLVWPSSALQSEGAISTLALTHGPAFWLHTIYAYALIGLGTVALLRMSIQAPHLYRPQAVALLAAVGAPWIANGLFIMHALPGPRIDLTPFTFIITGPAIAWALFRRHLLDLVPVARDTLIEHMTDAVLVFDRPGRLIDLNPAAARLLGRPARQLVGRPAAGALTEFPALLDSLTRPGAAPTELTLGGPAGAQIFDMQIAPLQAEIGATHGHVVVLRDISERKQVAAQLRLQAAALEAASTAMTILDRAGQVTWINSAFTRLTGFGSEALVGHGAGVWLTRPEEEDQAARMWQAVLGGQVAQGELWVQHHNGDHFLADVTGTPVRDEAGTVTHCVVTVQDITARRAQEAELHYLAGHDPLTGLLNRRGLEAVLAGAVGRAAAGLPGALLFLDLDRFKAVNDRAGHAAGDALLQALAGVLRTWVREGDQLGRLGGDEFAVLLDHAHLDVAALVAERICSEIQSFQFDWDGVIYTVGVSIGLMPVDGRYAAATILDAADAAMYRAKQQGGNAVMIALDDNTVCDIREAAPAARHP